MKALYVILPDDLYLAVKTAAFEEGLTLKKLLIKMVLKYLKEREVKNGWH